MNCFNVQSSLKSLSFVFFFFLVFIARSMVSGTLHSAVTGAGRIRRPGPSLLPPAPPNADLRSWFMFPDHHNFLGPFTDVDLPEITHYVHYNQNNLPELPPGLWQLRIPRARQPWFSEGMNDEINVVRWTRAHPLQAQGEILTIQHYLVDRIFGRVGRLIFEINRRTRVAMVVLSLPRRRMQSNWISRHDGTRMLLTMNIQ